MLNVIKWVSNMKNKIKTTSFWLSIGGSLVIVISCLSNLFGFEICTESIENIIISVCSLLVMLGVISKKTEQDTENIAKDELIADIENFKNNDKK